MIISPRVELSMFDTWYSLKENVWGVTETFWDGSKLASKFVYSSKWIVFFTEQTHKCVRTQTHTCTHRYTHAHGHANTPKHSHTHTRARWKNIICLTFPFNPKVMELCNSPCTWNLIQRRYRSQHGPVTSAEQKLFRHVQEASHCWCSCVWSAPEKKFNSFTLGMFQLITLHSVEHENH